jgi:hypothetical protein
MARIVDTLAEGEEKVEALKDILPVTQHAIKLSHLHIS